MDIAAPFSLSDHLGGFSLWVEWLVSGIEIFAVAILMIGLVRFGWEFVSGEALRREPADRSHSLNVGRLELGRHILAALEVFIVADLIRVVLHLTLVNLVILGALVVIRSVISFFLERELRELGREERS